MVVSGPTTTIEDPAPATYDFLEIDAGGQATFENGATGLFAGGPTLSSGSTIAGSLTLSGIGTSLTVFGTITSTGTVALGAGTTPSGDLVSDNPLEDDGLITMSGATASISTIGATGVLSGFGTLNGLAVPPATIPTLTNNGVINASGGTLDVTDAVTGTGTLEISAEATLELGASTGETISFNGFAGTLALKPNVSAGGFIGGFGLGDSIDLIDTRATTLRFAYSGGDTNVTVWALTPVPPPPPGGKYPMLVVLHEVAAFNFQGTLSPSAIGLTSDGHGGTLLYDSLLRIGPGFDGAGLLAAIHSA